MRKHNEGQSEQKSMRWLARGLQTAARLNESRKSIKYCRQNRSWKGRNKLNSTARVPSWARCPGCRYEVGRKLNPPTGKMRCKLGWQTAPLPGPGTCTIAQVLPLASREDAGLSRLPCKRYSTLGPDDLIEKGMISLMEDMGKISDDGELSHSWRDCMS
jgi:hypothetical protein